jgi:hypothetical protein
MTLLPTVASAETLAAPAWDGEAVDVAVTVLAGAVTVCVGAVMTTVGRSLLLAFG